jgi:hypothetical protein
MDHPDLLYSDSDGHVDFENEREHLSASVISSIYNIFHIT